MGVTTLASVGAAGLFVAYATLATGKPPALGLIAGLVYLGAALTAAGKPSGAQAGLSSLALLAAGCAAAVRPGLSANEMCGGALAGVALVQARQLVGNTALLAAGLDGKLRPLLISLLPTKLVVLIYSA